MTELVKEGTVHLKKIATAIIVIDCARSVVEHYLRTITFTGPTYKKLLEELRQALEEFDRTPV